HDDRARRCVGATGPEQRSEAVSEPGSPIEQQQREVEVDQQSGDGQHHQYDCERRRHGGLPWRRCKPGIGEMSITGGSRLFRLQSGQRQQPNRGDQMAEYIPSPRQWVRDQVDLYEKSGGKEGTTLRDTGLTVIIVPHRGNKTGAIRKTPLMRVKDGARYVLVGSMGGAPTNPVWV